MKTIAMLFDELREEHKDKDLRLCTDKKRDVEIPQLNGKYRLSVTPIAFGANYWNYLAVEIFMLDGEVYRSVGAYLRNYSALYDTFHPFKKNGVEYALYSRNYTATRVMRLPDCVDVAGESPHSHGFCPTDYYVPQPNDVVKEPGDEPNESLDGSFGFVAGCVWGDDSSWKIQHLDLSKIEEGKLERDDRFGYIELPSALRLREAIDVDWSADSSRIGIRTELHFDRTRSVDIDFSSLLYREYEAQLNAENPSRILKCLNCNHVGKYHGGNGCLIWSDANKGRCGCKDFKPSETKDEEQ